MQLFTFICSAFSVLSDFEKYRYICTATHKFKYCGEYSYTHTHTQADTLIHKTLLHSRAKIEERENAAENDQTAKSVDDSLLTHTHTHRHSLGHAQVAVPTD